MAKNDDRQILVLRPDKDGKVSLLELNEVLRQIQESVNSLEGRVGSIALRDDVSVMGALTLEGRVATNGVSSAPGVSDANSGCIYFDKAQEKFQASENGGAYVDLIYTSPLTTKGDLLAYGTGVTRLPVGSNLQLLTADSAQATGVRWGTFHSVVTLGADFTINNSTALSDVTGFSFSVAANTKYHARFIMRCSTSGGSNYKFALTGPAAPTSVLYFGYGANQAASNNAAIGFGTAANLTNANVPEGVVLEAYVSNGANAGTVQLQFAQFTATAVNTTVFSGSICVIEVLP